MMALMGSSRASGIQGQRQKMVNHPNRSKKSACDLAALDISRNRKRPPEGSTIAFLFGWRACEAGQHINPYEGSPSNQPPEWDQWNKGMVARGDVGFDYSHRVGSGTRLGPFQY